MKIVKINNKEICVNNELYNAIYQQGRADAETEHDKMCETCIHKVSAEDIKAIEEKARAEQKAEDNEFFNFESAWELEKQKIRADVIDEFVKWAYVRGIDFSFMGKITEDGKSDVPQRLQKIKDSFWEQLKENL